MRIKIIVKYWGIVSRVIENFIENVVSINKIFF